jgi:hypothetical protein
VWVMQVSAVGRQHHEQTGGDDPSLHIVSCSSRGLSQVMSLLRPALSATAFEKKPPALSVFTGDSAWLRA